MKLLHIAPLEDDLCAGLTYSIPSLLRAQQQAGAKVALLLTTLKGRPPYCREEPFPVVHYSSGEWMQMVAGVDLVVFHSTYIPVHAKIAGELRRQGVPYIITPRGGMTGGAQRIRCWKKKIGNWLFFNRLVKGARAIHYLTVAEAEASAYWKKPGFVVNNGVDLPDYELCESPRMEHRKLIYIGRIDFYHKGIDLLLEACRLLAAEGTPYAHLTFYGPEDGGDAEALRKTLARDDQLKNWVDFSGPVSGSRKIEVLHGADAFVLTSRFEGHPMAVLEALAQGTPCLLTPGTHMADEVVTAGAGWKVDPDPKAIAEGLRTLLDDSEDRRERARALANHHRWDRIAEQTLEAYAGIVKRNAESSRLKL